MGLIKTLSLQLLPLQQCFHLPSSSEPSSSTSKAIRLIASDGQVKVLKQPIPASVLMQQNPLHLICSSDSFFIGQKVPTLSAQDQLQPGHSYFILPAHFFHSVLSFVTLSSSLLLISNKSSPLCSFDVCKTEKGLLQVRLRNNAHCHDDDDDDDDNGSKKSKTLVVNSEELEKEYRQLVGGGRWKPRLETIREKKSRRRVNLLLNTRRREKLGE